MAVTVDATKGAYIIPALAGSGYVPLGGGTMTGALTIASGTLTASAPAVSVTQTWNNGAVGFTGALIDITSTASAGASYPLLIKVNGSNVFEFTKAGRFNCTQLSSVVLDVGSASDALLYRDAAATLAQRNGTNAQTLRVYGTYTDSSNYERLSLSTTAGSSVNITAETLGTGGDNIDIVLTPAGTGAVRFPSSSSITSDGFALITGMKCALVGSFNYYAAGARFSSTSELAWTNGDTNAAVDVALFRDVAGQAKITDGGSDYRDLKLRNLIQTAYHEVAEMTAPAAPATNSVRIYAEDNGAGKTKLMALFATGAAQQIAIEP